MDFTPAEPIARAVLYEGYLLYPYRPSAPKNRHRWLFGCLFPPSYCPASERSHLQTECLLRGNPETTVEVRVRFLQVAPRAGNDGAEEREVVVRAPRLADLMASPLRFPFAVAPVDGDATGLAGEVGLSVHRLTDGAYRLTIRVENRTPFDEAEYADRDEALARALASCQLLVGLDRGRFVSLLDPPAELKEAAERCSQEGCWPVLVGDPGRADLLLAVPIVLEDYPQVAPESPGDLFDGTEIDELLTLRVLTLSAEEKQELAADARARHLLQRSEALSPDQLQRLHAARRDMPPVNPVDRAGKEIRKGARVRLWPAGRADIFDLALAGRTAVVASIDEDREGRIHLSVAVDDDPGRDLGLEGRPGHRFFFRPEEVETLDAPPSRDSLVPRILVAGIGNIFLGDDAFGIEVVRRLAGHPLPVGTEVRDFGIRGVDLVYALQADYDAVILVDTVRRGRPPGTLHVLEPVIGKDAPAVMEPHRLDPAAVLRAIRDEGGRLPLLRLVGCEPATFEPGEADGLSEPVRAAVDEAVAQVLALVDQLNRDLAADANGRRARR